MANDEHRITRDKLVELNDKLNVEYIRAHNDLFNHLIEIRSAHRRNKDLEKNNRVLRKKLKQWKRAYAKDKKRVLNAMMLKKCTFDRWNGDLAEKINVLESMKGLYKIKHQYIEMVHRVVAVYTWSFLTDTAGRIFYCIMHELQELKDSLKFFNGAFIGKKRRKLEEVHKLEKDILELKISFHIVIAKELKFNI